MLAVDPVPEYVAVTLPKPVLDPVVITNRQL